GGGFFLVFIFLVGGVVLGGFIRGLASLGGAGGAIFLLVFKFCFLLGASWLLLTRISPDAVSFAVGVNCLILALLWDRLYDTKIGR
ncbi:MAG: hypothetical protein OXK82_07485, partial [Deltaproteobacteria bacterium]|nr:hypothetical protein [Deltaproteobacteria bacterium]